MSPLFQVRTIDGVRCGRTSISIGLVALPDRRRGGEPMTLLRVRLATDDGNALSLRLGAIGAGKLIAALERAAREAWPDDADEDGDVHDAADVDGTVAGGRS